MLFIPSPIIFSNYLVAIILGAIISIKGEAIRALVMGLVNIQHGGKDRNIYSSALITDGIFSHCRNPLYIGNILILLGLGVAANSLLFVLILIPLFIFFYQAIVVAEESFLTENFGAPYLDYKSKVNRWFPDFQHIGKTLSTMRFSIQRVFIKEYNSTYLWMTGFVLVIMKSMMSHNPYQFKRSLPYFLMVLILLLSCYLLIRFMKKSRRWIAD